MTVYYDPDKIESGAFPAMLAIGDSWFWYPFVTNLLAEISAIVRPAYSNILTLGKVGATLQEYAEGKFAPELARQLSPNYVVYYSALLISGGGNDAVDWGLCLKTDCTGIEAAADCIDAQTLDDKMTELGGWLLALINEAQAACDAVGRPRMDIFVHCYDYAPPNGIPASFLGFPLQGPWLKPAMDKTHVDPNNFALRQDIVKLLIDRLCETFVEFEDPTDPNNKVHVIRSAGTLDPNRDWANELHPNGDGFRKLVHGPWAATLQQLGYIA
jgi:hypothetical protein